MNSLHLRARLGVRGIDLELDVPEGETVAILGPNGAGKSTLLQLVSGVVAPDEGIVRLGEDVLTDTVSNTVVPIHARGVATLSQEALLFPHMDARTNVAFAPRSAGANRVAARAVADT
ncbi:MAG: ATP-binding cassette domain-containing protein, partial [Rhodococcus sp. (in: high G+C Gram-positive bacteria)]